MAQTIRDFLYLIKNKPMKLKLSFFLALLLVQLTFSQDAKELKDGAQKVYDATMSLNYDAILDLTYPKLFEIVPREQLRQMIVQTFNGNEEMKVKLINVAPNFSFGEIKKIDNHSFCLINHNLSMEIILKVKLTPDEATAMLDLFKEAMETREVTFDKEKNAFKITKIATMIAIADESTKNQWKYFNRDKKNALLSTLFGEKVAKELGL